MTEKRGNEPWRTRRLPGALALAAAALAAIGCPGAGGEGGIARVDADSLVTVVTSDDVRMLDPHVTSDGGNIKVLEQIYECLVRVHPDDVGQLVPELAESWEVAPDGLSIEFRLRAGVRFHDGGTLDAAAVKLSLDRMREAAEGLQLPASPFATELARVVRIEAEGLVLRVVLDAPVARVVLRTLSMFACGVVSPRLLEATRGMGPVEAANHITRHPAGTGAYRVEDFDPAAKIVRLGAFSEHWRGAPAIATLIFKQIADEPSRGELLRRSQDVLVVDDVPRQMWGEVEAAPRLELRQWWAMNVCFLGINARHEKTGEPALRRAIALAVDRAKVLEQYEGTARATYSLIAQPMPEYDPQLRVEGWDEDLAARREVARRLVREAGAEGRALTLYHPLQPRPYLPRPKEIADTIRQQLNAIGLEVTIQAEDKNKLFPSIPTGRYELMLLGWTTDSGDAHNFYTPLADGADGRPSATNTSRVLDPEVHAKLVAAQQIQELDARVAAYREVETLLQRRHVAYVPLVNTRQALAITRGLEGLIVDPLGHYRFHAATLVRQ